MSKIDEKQLITSYGDFWKITKEDIEIAKLVVSKYKCVWDINEMHWGETYEFTIFDNFQKVQKQQIPICEKHFREHMIVMTVFQNADLSLAEKQSMLEWEIDDLYRWYMMYNMTNDIKLKHL